MNVPDQISPVEFLDLLCNLHHDARENHNEMEIKFVQNGTNKAIELYHIINTAEERVFWGILPIIDESFTTVLKGNLNKLIESKAVFMQYERKDLVEDTGSLIRVIAEILRIVWTRPNISFFTIFSFDR